MAPPAAVSNKVKQYIWAAAILMIAFVFIIGFRPGATLEQMGAPTSGPTCAVENDGRCIVSQSDFITAFRLIASGQLEEGEMRDRLRGIVVEGLIQRWLLLDDAERLGIRVSEDDVTRGLGRGLARVSLPVDIEESRFTQQLGLALPPDGPARAMGVLDPKTQRFDYERYKKWVQRVTNKTISDFRDFATREELASRMRELIKSRVRVSEQEGYAVFAQNAAKLVADYVELDRDFFTRFVDASPEAVAKWAEQNAKEVDEAFDAKKDDFAPTCRKARHIFARVDDAASDKEAAKKKAREKIEAAKKRLDKGDDFAKVAREMSDDAQSAPSGGELGCFAAGHLAKPNTAKAVDDEAYKLAKGKVSEPIESSAGFHLVEVDAVLEGDAATKEGKAEIARDKYLKAEADRMAAETAKQVLAAVKGGKTLQQALDAQLAELAKKEPAKKGDEAAIEPPKVKTSGEFTAAQPPFPGVEEPAAAARMLFALDKPGSVAPDVIKLYDGYAVAALKEKKPLDPKDWEQKRGQILTDLRAEKERDALTAYVHELRQKRGKGIKIVIALHEEREEKKPKKGSKEEPPPPPPEAPPIDNE